MNIIFTLLMPSIFVLVLFISILIVVIVDLIIYKGGSDSSIKYFGFLLNKWVIIIGLVSFTIIGYIIDWVNLI